jgi:hypothetical protein
MQDRGVDKVIRISDDPRGKLRFSGVVLSLGLVGNMGLRRLFKSYLKQGKRKELLLNASTFFS